MPLPSPLPDRGPLDAAASAFQPRVASHLGLVMSEAEIQAWLTAIGILLTPLIALAAFIQSLRNGRAVAVVSGKVDEVKVSANGAIREAGVAGEERGRVAEVARREAEVGDATPDGTV